MKVITDIKGTCMERVKPKEGDAKRQVRVFQEGNPELVTVTVHDNIYTKAEPMKPIIIPQCLIATYNMDGSFGMYAKQQF